MPAYLPRTIPSGYTYKGVFFRGGSKGFRVDFAKQGGRVGRHGYIEWLVYPETTPCDTYEVGKLGTVLWSGGGSKASSGRFYWRCYQPVGSNGRPIVTSLFVQGDSGSPKADAIAAVATAQRLTN